MSPVRASQRHRYPPDWAEISAAIKWGRAGGRCECEGECGSGRHAGRCEAVHGQPSPYTGSRVVLTTAHRLSLVHLPMQFRVTRSAQADEVVELVGLLMASKCPDRDDVVHMRALAEFVTGPAAGSARFVVAFPGGLPGGLPGGAVIGGSETAGPVWVILSRWSLGRPPGQAAYVTAESASSPEMVARDLVLGPAAFACPGPEPSLAPAREFSAAGVRASAGTIRRLLRRNRDDAVADCALNSAGAAPFGSADAGMLDALFQSGGQLELTGIGAGLAGRAGVVREKVSADSARDMGRAQPGAGHGQCYHLGQLPENCNPAHLLAACQMCHLSYDADQHRETRRNARLAEPGTLFSPGDFE